MSKAFIDTHILAYALDRHDPKKRAASRALLKDLSVRHEAVISTQVLQEFYVIATAKLGVKPLLAKGILHTFTNMEVVSVDAGLVKEAIDASMQYKLSFRDALIVVAAESAHCDLLMSEDITDGQIIRTVKIVNPLRVH
jgi:predicted nucleic acid-binding protein